MNELVASGMAVGFYVVRGDCMSCGAPQMEAPALMSQCTEGECVFLRQPSTPDEVDSAVRAVWASCCGAVRYGGTTRDVLVRLLELGLSEQCDARMSDVAEVQRTEALFEWDAPDAERGNTCEVILRTLMQSMQRSKDTDVSLCESTGNGLSFRYSWARGILNGSEGCSVRISVEPEAQGRWRLRVEENERAAVSIAMHSDKVLRGVPHIRNLQWFSSGELARGIASGRSHPY